MEPKQALKVAELTVREMLEVLIFVEVCLWKLLSVDLEVELLTSPLRRTAKSPAGTPLNVTRKLPRPTSWTTVREIQRCHNVDGNMRCSE